MIIRIGTRKSKLALAQTEMVAAALKASDPDIDTEIVHISTRGDLILDRPLSELGGKGIFINEIETALLKGEIDIAVHSAKDLPAETAEGLEISCVLGRGDVRDCIVVRHGETIEGTAANAGTGSLRRRMFLKLLYPDMKFSEIRGNVDTRIKKLLDHEYDAVVLAAAGLERLGIRSDEHIDIIPFDTSVFLPAPCQAVIAVESRINSSVSGLLGKINDKKTFSEFETERYIVKRTGGSCSIPLGALAVTENDMTELRISAENGKIISGKSKIQDRLKLAERLVNEL